MEATSAFPRLLAVGSCVARFGACTAFTDGGYGLHARQVAMATLYTGGSDGFVDGTVRANKFHRTCRGTGDGMQAKGTRSNTGSPSGDRGQDQLATRESQAGPYGVAERSVRPMKPGNAGGGKGPQLKGTQEATKTEGLT